MNAVTLPYPKWPINCVHVSNMLSMLSPQCFIVWCKEILKPRESIYWESIVNCKIVVDCRKCSQFHMNIWMRLLALSLSLPLLNCWAHILAYIQPKPITNLRVCVLFIFVDAQTNIMRWMHDKITATPQFFPGIFGK